MQSLSLRGIAAALALAGCALVVACGAGGSAGDSTTCPVGQEGCACYPNATCDSTLACKSQLCVNLGSTGAAGTGSTSTGARADAGGSKDGGSAGTHGSVSTWSVDGGAAGGGASAGSGGIGTAGASASAGSGGAAGSNAVAGSSGAQCHLSGESCASDVNSCCNGSLCAVIGAATVCSAACQQGSDCTSGCCVGLSTGGSVCAPTQNCPPPNPCSTFINCMANNPLPGSGTGSCQAASSNANTAQFCADSVGCPSNNCGACLSGSSGCAAWKIDSANCNAEPGVFGSSVGAAMRAAVAKFCP